MTLAPEKGHSNGVSPASVNESAKGTSTPKKNERQGTREREIDRKLIERIVAGDRAAFREIYDRYHTRAYAIALGVVKNPQDARDVVQEAFIKVHRYLQNFQGSSSFYTWLYRIVMNLSIDHIRRTKRKKNVDYDDRIQRADDEIAGDGAILPRLLEGNPGKSALRKELAVALEHALDQLPEHHRAVILLREIEGMSYEEMSETLEVPKGTIMSRLFHARRKMQQSLAEYLDGGLKLED
jgi:RNA polymerase sigma-70 factor (ECF subfamily)